MSAQLPSYTIEHHLLTAHLSHVTQTASSSAKGYTPLLKTFSQIAIKYRSHASTHLPQPHLNSMQKDQRNRRYCTIASLPQPPPLDQSKPTTQSVSLQRFTGSVFVWNVKDNNMLVDVIYSQ